MSDQTRVVKVNGIKMEVDLRNAKVVENYRVGDAVKVLVKEYQDKYKTCPGVIIGFDAFEKLPTIVIAYIESSYNSAEIKTVHLNGSSEDVEIVPIADEEFLNTDKCRIEDLMDRHILAAEQKLEEEKAKKAYFLKYFGLMFKDVAE